MARKRNNNNKNEASSVPSHSKSHISKDTFSRGKNKNNKKPLKISAFEFSRTFDTELIKKRNLVFNHASGKWEKIRPVEEDNCKKAKESNQVFITKLCVKSTKKKILKSLSRFGKIDSIDFGKFKKEGGRNNNGFCFMKYVDEDGSKKALAAKTIEIDGSNVEIKLPLAQDPNLHALQILGINSFYNNADVRKHFSRFGKVVDVITIARCSSRVVYFSSPNTLSKAMDRGPHTINGVELQIRKVKNMVQEEDDSLKESPK